jgi:hypothetical protein
VLLRDSDEIGGAESVCVTDANFLCEHMDSYNGQREIFIRVSAPQSSVQSLTEILGIFEFIFDNGFSAENCG